MAKEHAPEMPVRFYRTDAGGEPVLEWLRSLDRGDRRVLGLGLDAGAIRVAHRNASSTKPEERSVGSSLNAAEPTDCTADAVLPPGDSGRASWFYQDPQDASSGAC